MEFFKITDSAPEYYQEFASVTNDDVYSIKESLLDTFKDTSKPLSNRISFAIDAIKKFTRAQGAMKYREMNLLSKDLNDMYNKIVALSDTNDKYAFKFRNLIIPRYIDYVPTLYSKETKKSYQPRYSQVYYDPTSIKQLIEYVIEKYRNAGEDIITMNDEKYKIQKELSSYLGWIKTVVPCMYANTYKNLKLSTCLTHAKGEFDKAYVSYLYASNMMLSYNLLYLQLMEKMYDTYKVKIREYKDPDVVMFVEETFDKIISYMIEGNRLDSEVFAMYTDCFKGVYNQLSSIYDIIQSEVL